MKQMFCLLLHFLEGRMIAIIFAPISFDLLDNVLVLNRLKAFWYWWQNMQGQILHLLHCHSPAQTSISPCLPCFLLDLVVYEIHSAPPDYHGLVHVSMEVFVGNSTSYWRRSFSFKARAAEVWNVEAGRTNFERRAWREARMEARNDIVSVDVKRRLKASIWNQVERIGMGRLFQVVSGCDASWHHPFSRVGPDKQGVLTKLQQLLLHFNYCNT